MFNLELPINPLSLGQVSFGILHELFERNIQPNIFPIGQIDLSAFDYSREFQTWLTSCINSSLKNLTKAKTSLKIWHLNGSWNVVQAQRHVLFTAHETDTLTETEVDIIKSKDTVFFTSDFSVDKSKELGLTNTRVCHNFFDSRHFHKKEVPKNGLENVVTFGLFGKMEKRKLTTDILAAWGNKFANNPKYRLNCCIFNSFLDPNIQKNTLETVFKGNIPWNINFLPFQGKNSTYNDVLNSIDIDLSGLSGAEGWNLPAFQSLCLDKVVVFMDAHGHKTYINDAECIKVKPANTVPIYDNIFFVKGQPFNQGNMSTFSQDSFNEAVDKALTMVGTLNGNGEKISKKFSVQNTVDTLLSSL